MAKKQNPSWVEILSAEQRIERAKVIIDQLIDHVCEVIELHESNRILIYSDKLSAQVPRSIAAHSFNSLVRSQGLFEIVRLLALWDSSGRDRHSIPSAVELLDNDKVCRILVERQRRNWSEEDSFGEVMAERCRKRLLVAKHVTQKVQNSKKHRALRDLRDKDVAHNLVLSDEPAQPNPNKPKFGDERWLLNQSRFVVECLNIGARHSCFAWNGSKIISQKRAEAFWNGVTVNVQS